MLNFAARTDTPEPILLQRPYHRSRNVSASLINGTLKHLTHSLFTRLLDRRVVIQATPARVAGTVWCAPHTTTWMLIRLGITFAGTSTTELLIDSYNQIQDQITTVGDGNLVNGMFEFKRYGLQFVATNANNHQLTRAVLEAAITGVWQFIRQLQYQQGVQGTATFQIFDGVNQVGAASIAQIDPS